MSEKLRIAERLKEISAEIVNNNNIPDEQRNQDHDDQFDALEAEALELRTALAVAEKAEVKQQRQQLADDLAAQAAAGRSSHRTTTPNATGTRIGRIKLAIEDDPKRGFTSLAHFAARVFDSGQQPRSDQMLMQVAAGTGLNQSVNSDGAVLVPPAFSRTIWDKVLQKSNSLLGYCDVLPIDPGIESVTIPAIAESSRADGSRMGGIRGYWKSELGLMSESKAQLREVKFSPQELYVFAFISDKLIRNAPATASKLIEDGAADEIAFKIGDSIINGDGNGKPRGVVGHAATINIAAESGQSAATIQTENIRKMNARCHVNWSQGAAWFVNQDVLPALDTLKFEVGVGGVPVFLPPGGLSDSPYSRLYGKPVIPIEYCNTLGTSGDIILANLKAYGAAVKGMVDSAWSMHLKFDYAQSAYRVIFEIDGQPWLNTAITPFKGSNTTSPILTLATRS